MSNTVDAGFNNTTVTNSTNVTEIFNLTNKTDDKVNRTIPPKHNETIEKNKTDTRKSKTPKITKARIDGKATGNPLIALILVLIETVFFVCVVICTYETIWSWTFVYRVLFKGSFLFFKKSIQKNENCQFIHFF